VCQQTKVLPLQPIVSGRYHDTFHKVDGEWLLGARGPAQNYVVGGEFLIPFSDPDNSDASRTDKPITVTA